MKFTDLFVKRPVLAIVVNLVILIAGLQSIRSLSVRQYPRSDIAVIRVTHRLHRRQRRPGARLHHHAARARDRQRGRHRLHGVVERPGPQHDHRAPEAQLRHQRRPHPDPGQGGAGAQRPAAGGGGAGHRAGDRGQPVRGHVPRLLLRRAGPEPDHRLPDPRGAAASSSAISGVQRADILGDRTFAMRVWLKPDKMAALGISPSAGARRPGPATTTSPPWARPRARWCR